MTDIVTLTLNPSLDLSTSVSRLKPDHKLRCEEPRCDPGGGGVNVARVISRLGGDVTAVYTAGGPSGAMLERLLRAEGVASHVVLTHRPTRENFHVFEDETKQQYRFFHLTWAVTQPVGLATLPQCCHLGISHVEISRLQWQSAARHT
jgi:6-phosphofructokinase 2